MEEEDFGFTRRADKVLQKVMCPESPAGGSLTENRAQGDVPDRLNTNGGFLNSQSEGVAKGQDLPETGSQRADNNKELRSKAPVSVDTPNIPNVVEYHLKVKPGKDKRPASNNTEGKNELRKYKTSDQDGKSLPTKMSKLSMDVFEGSSELPQTFQVKYLGSHDARGLWGIKHTRRPVDNMVASARSLPTGMILPLIKLIVSEDGVSLLPLVKKKLDGGMSRTYPIETISYGVQDLVYTRVFSMIVVRETGNIRGISPFECHAFVCESKHHARQLTYALASAFQVYSQSVRAQGKSEESMNNVKKRFAIDLRSPDEIEADLNLDSEA